MYADITYCGVGRERRSNRSALCDESFRSSFSSVLVLLLVLLLNPLSVFFFPLRRVSHVDAHQLSRDVLAASLNGHLTSRRFFSPGETKTGTGDLQRSHCIHHCCVQKGRKANKQHRYCYTVLRRMPTTSEAFLSRRKNRQKRKEKKKKSTPSNTADSGDEGDGDDEEVEMSVTHPLRMEHWVIHIRTGIFKPPTEIKIRFLRDGRLITEDGLEGYWHLDRYGILWEIPMFFRPPTREPRGKEKESSSEKGGGGGGESRGRDQQSPSHADDQSVSWSAEIGNSTQNVSSKEHSKDVLDHNTKDNHCQLSSCEVEPIVFRFSAELNWNSFGSRPRMCRGIVSRDRVSTSRLPYWLFRPVTATFYGYGTVPDFRR